ncbi:site-2 protease family protein [Cyclobacterium plantarum]|uniref:Site-2 protease family protein n=1 Tax=Cyclobacterium plantarum TaxID=2716263 RepID=A0ABX0H8D9_9BACT|nr:site-2 protease family protein [Cyclobacterium plantarum]NHE56687.1 site-2 protease family protein [Cyclobacterium plantarum]
MYSAKDYLKHGILFLLTLIATTLAGGEWLYGRSVLSDERPLTWEYFFLSMQFSIPFIGILLVHELGHLFTSLYHKVRSSLPFFIPAWLGFIGAPSIGTFGAVIQMKSLVSSRKKFFDIGVAGPLAGFVLALAVLTYGFTNLPEASYIYEIHPEYADPGYEQEADENVMDVQLGYNLLFWLMEKSLADPERMPNMAEVIHYPYLFAGYLALFFTALNLLPIGQLDGGHVVFGILPKQHEKLSLIAYTLFLFFAGLGVVNPFEDLNYLMFALPLYVGFLYICFRKSPLSNVNKWIMALGIAAVQYSLSGIYPGIEGYSGWLLFAFLVGRVLGIRHPEVLDGRPLDQKRKILGWIAIVIFILCFIPKPFVIE